MTKKRVNMMLEEEQFERLKTLSRLSRIRMSEFIREGLEWVLAKKEYRRFLKGRKKEG